MDTKQKRRRRRLTVGMPVSLDDGRTGRVVGFAESNEFRGERRRQRYALVMVETPTGVVQTSPEQLSWS